MSRTITFRLLAISVLVLASSMLLVIGLSQDLSKEANRNITLIAACACALAGTTGLLLSRRLQAGLKKLAQGMRRLASGELATRLDEKQADEIGLAASDFNGLAGTLEGQSQAQRQWMAEAAHEIRTPIAVLRAQVEALQDGVQQVNARTLGVLHNEVMALSKLADNLNSLSRSDVGQLVKMLSEIDILPVLNDTLAAFADRFAEKSIRIEKEIEAQEPCIVSADSNRIRQVFFNLLENSVRYTNSGGVLKVACQRAGTHVVITFEDSEPGMTGDMLDKIFERFFRGEISRSRSMGGSGLGLAICKDIVEAHAGTIEALPSSLGGLRMQVRLPLGKEPTRG